MTSRLSSIQLEEVTPLLGPLARLIARGVKVSDGRMQALLLGAGVGSDDNVVAELGRWTSLLVALRDDATSEMRSVTEEALRLCGVAEASAVLATQIVLERVPVPLEASLALTVNPARLDFGMLKLGESADAELVVAGGPGELFCDSDQVSATPGKFGSDPTSVTVRVSPMGSGTLWTKIRLVSDTSALDVPVIAIWLDPEPAASSTPPLPPPSRPRTNRQDGQPTPTVARPPRIKTHCPACGRVMVAPGTNVKCPDCAWMFTIDAGGLVVSGTPIATSCPQCHSSFEVSEPGDVDCPDCRWNFEIDSTGKVAAGIPIDTSCPKCATQLVVNWPGDVTCPECRRKFAIDERGRVL